MELIPMDIGPLNPPVEGLVAAVVLFTVCHLVLRRLMRRIDRVLEARDQATDGVRRQAQDVRADAEARLAEVRAVLADARHDAAAIRRRAEEEGAALIAAARADGVHQVDGMLAEAAARFDSDRRAAEAELRQYASELAVELASRVVGEPIRPAPRTPAAETR
ncbi:ATP synthase F0 subunit B [Streptomyces sp. 15-116A]|uniref:ATP synthase F0 subunit B n=1 Tax=Streptomyces sp. 15-116A TaxID=2259035 RepID=UPI0021B20F2A|nr:ATP synthase F0 subunit B [Streptomyces sp. 15-116A]MCT7353201.1 ATP synthase F0 subunit B [Streptomyces sp. 15-116A]